MSILTYPFTHGDCPRVCFYDLWPCHGDYRWKQHLKEQQNHSAWATKYHRTKKVQWVQQEPPIGYGYHIARLSADMSNAELSTSVVFWNESRPVFPQNSLKIPFITKNMVKFVMKLQTFRIFANE